MSMVNISRYEWAKLMRLYAAKNVHPMFNYHYATAIKQLDHIEKGYIKEAVDDCKDDYDAETLTEIYPILLIMTGQTGNSYVNLVHEIQPDRHEHNINMLYQMVKGTIAKMWHLFSRLLIYVESGSFYSKEEHAVIHEVQAEYKRLFAMEIEKE